MFVFPDPSVPQNVTMTAGDDAIHINWPPTSQLYNTTYYVRYKKKSGSTWTYIPLDPTLGSQTIDGLDPRIRYQVSLVAENINGVQYISQAQEIHVGPQNGKKINIISLLIRA